MRERTRPQFGTVLSGLCVAIGIGCSDPPLVTPRSSAHSSSIAIGDNGAQIYVVNPDADSLSVIDTRRRALVTEISLGAPRVDADTFTPSVMPRAVAIAPGGKTAYVTGQRAGALFAIDLATRRVRSVAVGNEPIGVVVSADAASIYVACSGEQTVVEIAASTLTVTRTAHVGRMPWSLAWSPTDGSLLVTDFLGPGVGVIDPVTLAVRRWKIPSGPARGDPRLAHGEVRGLYDIAARPGSGELWVAHLWLAIDTPQPRLDFETTVFPALSVLRSDGTYRTTLSIDSDVPGVDGAFGDVVSGPHALAFTEDGEVALVVDTNSEDVVAVDATRNVEAALLRPLPGHMPEGIVVRDGFAYVDERNTGDVAVIRIDRTGSRVQLAVEGTIARSAVDPMPAQMRFGQHLFYSANSDEYPITRNHWVACASCHLEGRTDAVTWLFLQGPRDTPSNAGGMRETGFLFRTADRARVQDYWHTIELEQGGTFEHTAPELDALAAYVDGAIPLPAPPPTDPAKVALGRRLFERADVGCATCHVGPAFTDSGADNRDLDFARPILLHDVGSCVLTGTFPDVVHTDVGGQRLACSFDTPSLRGIAGTAPYLHDGSAPTLRDALERTRGMMGDITSLSGTEVDALVEYLRSL